MNTTALPLTPPDPGRATVKRLTLAGDNGLNTSPVPLVTFTASLDSLTVVPEPGALGVTGAAIAFLLLRRRH